MSADAPEQVRAICTREQALALIHFDHHAVHVRGRLGVLITYPWMERLVLGEALPDAPEVLVVFRRAGMHPRAPEQVQAVIDQLEFTAAGGLEGH